MKSVARTRVAWALLLALPLIGLWDALRLDALTTPWWADANGFAARHAFWAEGLLHNGIRGVMGLAVVAILVLVVRPHRAGPTRSELLVGLGAALAVSALVNFMKAHSLTSCPWDLAEFGGQAEWVSHWAWGRADGGPGHCFPSGHAGGAFALWGLCWPWWRHQRRWALVAFGVVAGLGVMGSLGQWARGAHHLSHSFWAAWISAAGLWGLSLARAFWLWHQRPNTATDTWSAA
ncbi:phosphatase PAP2 family protein [Inhella gelatinilytica]|uniref:Phosphatase PAP2 family protein n=1 Tax=Inhella gelatinilytica TaxID=2795030 RepID=A0A931NAB5_9BURK|nr:phosphatase PAP2 family protein [Inhella gelatinilytica]MBH9552288.1 phosphatase PAP2 family protein [Inhella gelatinilytica]